MICNYIFLYFYQYLGKLMKLLSRKSKRFDPMIDAESIIDII